MSRITPEAVNIEEKFKELEWWDRPINETSYHSDDLAKIVLAVDWLIKNGVGSGLTGMTPIQAWFGEYNPGKSASEGNGLPRAKSALVKTTRYGDREIRNLARLQSQPPFINWLRDRYGHVIRVKKGDWIAVENCAYNLVGVATPNIKHFDAEDPTEVILMGEGRAPKELIRQIVYYLLARAMRAEFTESCGRECSLSSYRWDKANELWTSELYSQLTLRFSSSYRVKDKTNGIRQTMAYHREMVRIADHQVDAQQNQYANQVRSLRDRGDQVLKAHTKLNTTASNMSSYLLSLGQKGNTIKTAAQAASTQERENA
jgi:hypothetical protein